MTNKTLSNGTLALKFMQNAQRAKQQDVTKLAQAEVRDDAEWEISPQIREAWGLTSKAKNQDKQDPMHETSYLPFLFPSLLNSRALTSDDETPEAGSSKVAGRRKFSKGKEIAAVVEEVDTIKEDGRDDDMLIPDTNEQLSLSGRTSNNTVKGRFMKPHPLVGRSASKMAALDAFALPSGKKHISEAFSLATPVLDMISGETPAGVGLDMHKTRKVMVETSSHVSAGSTSFESHLRSGPSGLPSGAKLAENSKNVSTSFVRPAGVDAPVAKEEFTTARKVKKRARDGGEALRSDNSSSWTSPKPKKAKAIR